MNAVAHRDYSMAGARVRLHMFGNRLELHVPGALANTLTPESMDSRQYSRNELDRIVAGSLSGEQTGKLWCGRT